MEKKELEYEMASRFTGYKRLGANYSSLNGEIHIGTRIQTGTGP